MLMTEINGGLNTADLAAKSSELDELSGRIKPINVKLMADAADVWNRFTHQGRYSEVSYNE